MTFTYSNIKIVKNVVMTKKVVTQVKMNEDTYKYLKLLDEWLDRIVVL